jgi:hypothetical protein
VQVAAERPQIWFVVMHASARAGVSLFRPRPRNAIINLSGPSGIAVSMRSTEVRRLKVMQGKMSTSTQPPGQRPGQPTPRSPLPSYASYLTDIEPTDAWPLG